MCLLSGIEKEVQTQEMIDGCRRLKVQCRNTEIVIVILECIRFINLKLNSSLVKPKKKMDVSCYTCLVFNGIDFGAGDSAGGTNVICQNNRRPPCHTHRGTSHSCCMYLKKIK